MPDSQIWNTTVTEPLEIFRQSLIKLVPVMEEARLTWRESEAYDEWELIAQSLFNGICVSALKWGVNCDHYTDISLPDYGMVYPHYRGFSFIECVSEESGDDSHLLFHEFATNASPFDMVRCSQVTPRGDRVSEDLILKPAVGARFVLQLRRIPGELLPLTTLRVQVRSGSN